MVKMRVWTCLLILTSLVGCSAEWHLERAIKKDPTIVDTGSVFVLDTLIVREEVSIVDTFVTKEYDTLTMIDSVNGIETQIIRIKDTLFVRTKVLPDTIEIIKQMRSKPRKTIYLPIPWYKNVFFWVLAVLLVILWATRRSTK